MVSALGGGGFAYTGDSAVRDSCPFPHWYKQENDDFGRGQQDASGGLDLKENKSGLEKDLMLIAVNMAGGEQERV